MADTKRHRPGREAVPAFFLGALLTTDIPPYLTDGSGATSGFPHDPLATKLAEELNRSPRTGKKRRKSDD